MATNTILTTALITREILRLFVGNLKAVRSINKSFDSKFGVAGAKVGDTINVRMPNRFAVGSGAAVTPTDYTETVTPVVLNQQKNIALSFTSKDLTLALDDFSERFLKPMASKLASVVEQDVLSTIAQNSFIQVGTPGSVITDTGVFYDALAAIQSFLVPTDDLVMLISPRSYAKAGRLMTSLFTPVTNEKLMSDGIGRAFGYDWFTSQYLVPQTVGAYTGTPLVNGAGQTGSSIALDGFGNNITGALKKGDIISFAGVTRVNPMTGQAYADTSTHVVTADANSNGTGQVTVSIYPAITVSGPYKTVSGSPADNAAVTIAGAAGSTYNIDLLLHKDAAVFASMPLDVPGAVPGNVYTETDENTGISLTVEQFRNGATGETLWRVDALYGVAPLRKECAVRVVTGV